MRKVMILAVLVSTAMGCTYGSVTEAGDQVRVSDAAAVERCEHVGKTNARTRAKVWIFKRGIDHQAEELEMMARDDAAEMGGSDVVAAGEIEDGRQSFEIYRCPASAP